YQAGCQEVVTVEDAGVAAQCRDGQGLDHAAVGIDRQDRKAARADLERQNRLGHPARRVTLTARTREGVFLHASLLTRAARSRALTLMLAQPTRRWRKFS